MESFKLNLASIEGSCAGLSALASNVSKIKGRPDKRMMEVAKEAEEIMSRLVALCSSALLPFYNSYAPKTSE